MLAALAFPLLLAAAAPALAAEAPVTVHARIVSWDLGFRPKSLEAWVGRLDQELADALESGARVVLFPELFVQGLAAYRSSSEPSALFVTRTWHKVVLPRLEKRLRGKAVLVVLGSYLHQEPGWKRVRNRATIWRAGRFTFVDKLHPVPAELDDDPAVEPGRELPIFAFAGGKAVVLICFSVEMPEVAAKLKAEGVHLVLVPSATEDEIGSQRVLRTASARAVELGAALLVAPLTGTGTWKNQGAAAMYLPAQKSLPPGRSSEQRTEGIHRDDFQLPWTALLELRKNPQDEARPFLSGPSDLLLKTHP